jgi:glycolate oxidase
VLTATALSELAGAMPGGVVITDADRIEKYRMDRAFDPTAGMPVAVVRAENTAHVQATLRWAGVHGVTVTTRGAGTGLSGGSTACEGGVVLSTERMRAMHVDPTTRIAVVGPGLFNAEVKAAAAVHGLWYPPDPSSFEICSIGGNVATNAGGLCCVKYGVTSDYVLGLEVVLADATVICLGGPRLKDTAGLSLTKLMVGSEGILGVVTEVTLRLIPAQAAPATAVATFATDADATAAVLRITSALRPAMLEYMDAVAINAVEDMLRMGLDRGAAALLVAQSDAEGPARDREMAAIVAAFEAHRATEIAVTDDLKEGEAFVFARRSAIPAAERRGKLLLEDVGVPLPRLPDLVDGVHRIGAVREVEIALIAHAGDGNTHPLLVFDPADEAATARAEAAFGEIMDLAISLGGTITGEHGVGRLKRPWLGDQVGPDVMELTRRIKLAFDPRGILNPGVIL